MATQGPRFPGTVTTEVGPSGDNDWLNPSNVGADDAAEAQITAATYDANDHSWRLKAQNFGFTIPTGSTIDGITVEIERRAFAGAAEDQEVRLFDDTGTLVGDDKQKATAWPSTPTIDTYGGAADDWLPAGSWTPAQINDPDFGVALIVLATAANTDIGVDFIRVTVTYTPPPLSATRGLVSWTELETPLVPTRGFVSFTEFETPIAPTRGLVSWTELEAPIAPTRGLVSWAEQEVPSVGVDPTRGFISWSELQAPLVSARGLVSWAELEAPAVATRGLIAWSELEAPDVGSGSYLYWARKRWLWFS